MKELQMTIRQDGILFNLDVQCENNAINRTAAERVFRHYEETNGLIAVTYKAVSIIKLISMQMSFLCELTENGQI